MPPELIKAKRGQVFIAPVGTPFSAGGWEPIGHTTTDGLITADTISAKPIIAQKIVTPLKLSQELMELYYGHGIPQRWVAGLSPTDLEESTMGHNPRTFTNSIGATVTIDSNGIYPMLKTNTQGGTYSVVVDKDVPALAHELFKNTSKFKRETKEITLDGKPSIKVGTGSLAGIVYKPTTEEQATRNLNFALANLAAFEDWERTGRELAAKREAALKAAEKRVAEDKKRREEEAAKRAVEQAAFNRKRADALNFYNKVNNTSHYSWASVGLIGEDRIQKWIDLSESAKSLKQVHSTLGGSRLYPSPFGGFDRFRL